jgi:hypothetical protein
LENNIFELGIIFNGGSPVMLEYRLLCRIKAVF